MVGVQERVVIAVRPRTNPSSRMAMARRTRSVLMSTTHEKLFAMTISPTSTTESRLHSVAAGARLDQCLDHYNDDALRVIVTIGRRTRKRTRTRRKDKTRAITTTATAAAAMVMMVMMTIQIVFLTTTTTTKSLNLLPVVEGRTVNPPREQWDQQLDDDGDDNDKYARRLGGRRRHLMSSSSSSSSSYDDDDNYDDVDDFTVRDDDDDGTTSRQEVLGYASTTDEKNTNEEEWQELWAQIPHLPPSLFPQSSNHRSLVTWEQTGSNSFQISFGGGAVASTQSLSEDYGIGGNPSTRKHSKKGGGKASRRPTRPPSRNPTRPSEASRPTRSPAQQIPTAPIQSPTLRPPGFPPIAQPAVSPNLPPGLQPVQPTRPPTGGGGGGPADGFCMAPIRLEFLQFSAIPPALVPFPNDPNANDLGTRYVYNNVLRSLKTLDRIPGSSARGVCTRTQSRVVRNETNVVQMGGGVCDFTYTFTASLGSSNEDGQKRFFSVTVSGYLEDDIGGVLSVTGGTADAIGASGQIQLLPVNLGPNNSGGRPSFIREDGDVFIDPFFYLADMTLFLPCNNN